MAWFTRLTRQRAGQPIIARTLNDNAEATEWASRIRAAPPLSIVASIAGPLLRYAGPVFGVYVVVVGSGGITARSAGTPGTGNGIVQTWDGSVLSDLLNGDSSQVTMPLLSISSTTTGIPAGTYGIALRIFGKYWVISLDCGNI